MTKVLFSRNPLVYGKSLLFTPSTLDIKSTPGLWTASVDDALRYGGDLTRAAISAINIRGDRKYVVVDVKVHMLMPGFAPAILGYHTDGVPRGPERNPASKHDPDILAQEDPTLRSPRYHLLVTGTGCLTKFVQNPIELEVPDEPDPSLYKLITQQVRRINPHTVSIPSCQVVEWDWWNIHTGVLAQKHEWRYLIRVTETDFIQPQSDLREILRTQQQVYVPAEFGW